MLQRKANLKNKHAKPFVLSQHVTEMAIPRYDALRDPYLDDYF